MTPWHLEALATAARRPTGSTGPTRRPPRRAWSVRPRPTCCIVGGGFTGLWAALQAQAGRPGARRRAARGRPRRLGRERPQRRLPRGVDHARRARTGRSRFPDEIETLERLGDGELRRAQARPRRATAIDCDFEETGELARGARAARGRLAGGRRRGGGRRVGHEASLLDREAMRAEIASPTYLGGLWMKTGARARRPAQARRAGCGAWRSSSASGCTSTPPSRTCATTAPTVLAETRAGHVRARRVLLATNAYPPLLRAHRRATSCPVYDYVLVTEPLTGEQQRARSAGAAARASATARTSSTTTA